MLVQRTLTNSINAVGVGLHSGRRISIKLLPAEEDTGIIFRRVDLNPSVEIKAIVNNVGASTLATTLMGEKFKYRQLSICFLHLQAWE